MASSVVSRNSVGFSSVVPVERLTFFLLEGNFHSEWPYCATVIESVHEAYKIVNVVITSKPCGIETIKNLDAIIGDFNFLPVRKRPLNCQRNRAASRVFLNAVENVLLCDFELEMFHVAP